MLVTMSDKEIHRLPVIQAVCEKRLRRRDAASQLGISERQAQRLINRYRVSGAEGLVSRKRGQPSNRRLTESLKMRVLTLIRENYRLLEHRNFPKLIDLIRIYFQDTAAKGITARNQLIEMATASLSDLMKEHPEHRAEAKQDLQLLNAQKIGEHEAEIEKIKNVFLAILRDIKKDIDNGEQPGEAVTAAMFQAMRDALAEQKQKPLSIDDVTAMIAGQIGQLTPMDKETVEMFQQFAKKMIEQAGTK